MKGLIILISIFGTLFYAGEKYSIAHRAEILTGEIKKNEAEIAQARERIEFLEIKNKMICYDLQKALKRVSQ